MASIRKRANGSYQFKYSGGYGTDGKQRTVYTTWQPPSGMTERQIQKELQRRVVLFDEECRRGKITSNIKFEVFAEQWFDEYASVNLRPTSLERMKQLRKRVYKYLGHKRLDKITSRDIQQFVNELMTNDKNEKTGKPLARKTVVHHLSLISDVLEYAVRMNMLTDNPCRRVRVPKAEQEEKTIYSFDDLKVLCDNLKGEASKYQVFFILAVYSGYRRSEMLGLEWKDIDFEQRTIKIRRTSQYTKAKGIYTDTTKTRKSKRIAKFPPQIIAMLKRFKAEQEEYAKQLGTKWKEYDRLFTQWDGTPMNIGCSQRTQDSRIDHYSKTGFVVIFWN